MDIGAIGWGERTMQEDFRWRGAAGDTCERWNEEVCTGIVDLEYYDEQSPKKLDPFLVEQGEKAELGRFKRMGVYEYVPRDVMRTDPTGKNSHGQAGQGQ